MQYKQIDFNSIQLICKIDSEYIQLTSGMAGFYALHSQNNFNDVRLKIITNSQNIIEKSIIPYIHRNNAGKRCIITGRCFLPVSRQSFFRKLSSLISLSFAIPMQMLIQILTHTLRQIRITTG